jgi:hypothetical protein
MSKNKKQLLQTKSKNNKTSKMCNVTPQILIQDITSNYFIFRKYYFSFIIIYNLSQNKSPLLFS